MIFEQVPIGGDRNFGYIIGDEGSGCAALVDPAYCPDKLVEMCGQRNLEIELILNTHSHQDHVNGNATARRLTGAEILCHEAGASLVKADRALRDGETIELGQLRIRVLHTPGHTADSVCLLVQDKLITGDTLFVGKVGGTDYGKGAEQEYRSLHQLIKLPDTMQVYPGHDFGVTPSSTIGDERRTNPFLLQESFEEFVELKRHWLEYKQEHGIK